MQTTWIRFLLLGMLVVVAGTARADDEALRRKALGFNKVTGDDTITGEIKALLADNAGTKKLLAVAVKLAQDEKKQPFNYNAAYILARAAHGLRDLEIGRVFYRVCTKEATKLLSGQKLAESYLGFISLLQLHQKHEEVAKLCQEFLDLPEPDQDRRGVVTRMKSVVLRQMIMAVARQGKFDEATKMVDQILKAQPDNWEALEVKGQVEREAGRYAEAAKQFEKMLELIEKDKQFTAEDKAPYVEQCRYRLSNVYVDLKQIDKAAAQLKKLLEAKPDDPTYNNDLGFIWADHDMHLDEAEKLIRKALDEDRKQRKKIEGLTAEEDRDNAAYLDSLGWVHYKKKNYAEAKKWLLQASQERDGQHVEILDHLGDAHLALGEKAEAVAVWEKALKLPTTSRREDQRKVEVEKKIKEHKK